MDIKNTQWLNTHNIYKSSNGIRSLTADDVCKYILSDLNGNIEKGSRKTWRFNVGVVPLQDSNEGCISTFFAAYFERGIGSKLIMTNSNDGCLTYTGSNTSIGATFIPVYEYVDNSKSTNIYY